MCTTPQINIMKFISNTTGVRKKSCSENLEKCPENNPWWRLLSKKVYKDVVKNLSNNCEEEFLRKQIICFMKFSLPAKV